MSVKALTQSIAPNGQKNCLLATWTLANGDTGAPIETGDYVDVTVQVTGTFGAAGSVSLEGSNDGTNYVVLTDIAASAVTKTSAGLSIARENTRYKRPNCTAGDGTTVLVVTLWARRSR